MKNRIKSTLFFLLFTLAGMAQQDPQFSHDMLSHIAYNPGYAGSVNGVCATAIHRLQWVGFDGGPTTTFFAVDAGIRPFGQKGGIMLKIVSDKLGFESNSDLKLGYAHHFDVWDGDLGLGMDFGIVIKKIEGTWIFPEPSKGEVFPLNANVKTFDMDFGLFYTKGGFYGGLSASHLLSPTLALSEKQSTQLRRHYFAVSGYKFEAFSPSLEVVPSILVKSDGSSFQFSINTNVIYNKKFWGGVTYRAGDSVIAMLGLELVNGLKLGYAYDVTTSEMGKVSNGTHELMLNYCFELSVPQFTHKYKSARFL